MPYIEAERRKVFDKSINRLVGELASGNFCSGEVNYCLSRIIWELWRRGSGLSRYATGNDLIGVLECVKQEFYRRQVAPYEDEKLADNGDIV